MVAAVASARTEPAAQMHRPITVPPRPALRARPIPVAAYPAGTPRWITYGGRRQRVVAIHEQQDATRLPALRATRQLRVELADGRVLTLLHRSGGWYQRRD
jgi:hypothetical protein